MKNTGWVPQTSEKKELSFGINLEWALISQLGESNNLMDPREKTA